MIYAIPEIGNGLFPMSTIDNIQNSVDLFKMCPFNMRGRLGSALTNRLREIGGKVSINRTEIQHVYIAKEYIVPSQFISQCPFEQLSTFIEYIESKYPVRAKSLKSIIQRTNVLNYTNNVIEMEEILIDFTLTEGMTDGDIAIKLPSFISADNMMLKVIPTTSVTSGITFSFLLDNISAIKAVSNVTNKVDINIGDIKALLLGFRGLPYEGKRELLKFESMYRHMGTYEFMECIRAYSNNIYRINESSYKHDILYENSVAHMRETCIKGSNEIGYNCIPSGFKNISLLENSNDIKYKIGILNTGKFNNIKFADIHDILPVIEAYNIDNIYSGDDTLVHIKNGAVSLLLAKGEDIISVPIDNISEGCSKITGKLYRVNTSPLGDISKCLEGIDISKDGSISFSISKKRSYMDQYSENHIILVNNIESGNYEAAKDNLSFLFTLINTLDREMVNNRTDDIVRARAFAKNDFKTYMRKINMSGHKFDFMEYYTSKGYDKITLTVTPDNVTGLKKLLSRVLM